MASVNKVIIVGNLGADPDVKTFDNGGKIANISVATTDRWTDRNTGEQREATEWHRITFNDRLADIVAQYLRKGSQVYVEGSLRTRKWTDQQGIERYTTEIRATSMQMLGSRQGGNEWQGQGGGTWQGQQNNTPSYQTGGFPNQQYQNRNAFNQQPMNAPQNHNNDFPYGNDGGFNQGNFGNQGYQNHPQANSFGSPQMPQQSMMQAPQTGAMAQPQAPRPTPQEPKIPSAPQVDKNVADDDMPF